MDKKRRVLTTWIILLCLLGIALLFFSQAKKYVVLRTNIGSIKLELYPKKAPKTVENFYELVEKAYYDNKIFHRVIEDFMIQAGGITKEGLSEDLDYTLPDEINPISLGMNNQEILALEAQGYQYSIHIRSILLERGVIAMANRGPSSGNGQFFIVTAREGTPWLNGKHTAFGRVVKGMEVVDEISRQETNEGSRPVRRMIIQKAYITRWPW